jgi:hypothetical protein
MERYTVDKILYIYRFIQVDFYVGCGMSNHPFKPKHKLSLLNYQYLFAIRYFLLLFMPMFFVHFRRSRYSGRQPEDNQTNTTA